MGRKGRDIASRPRLKQNASRRRTEARDARAGEPAEDSCVRGAFGAKPGAQYRTTGQPYHQEPMDWRSGHGDPARASAREAR
jgi:hypothetical protein